MRILRFFAVFAAQNDGIWRGLAISSQPLRMTDNSPMSSVDPFVPGSTLLTYRLVERVGATTVWRAEDTRSGRKVAVKVLAKQLPRDATRRDALIRDVRLGGALFHTSLVNIVEISAAGDALVMVMDWFDGQPVSSIFRGKPADRASFFRVAYQLAEAL